MGDFTGRRGRLDREPHRRPPGRRRLLRGPLQGRGRELGPPRHHVDLLPAAEGRHPVERLARARIRRVHRARTGPTARRSSTPPATRRCSSSPHAHGRDARLPTARVAQVVGSVRLDVMPGKPSHRRWTRPTSGSRSASPTCVAPGPRTACPSGQGSDYTGKLLAARPAADHRQGATGPAGTTNGTMVDTAARDAVQLHDDGGHGRRARHARSTPRSMRCCPGAVAEGSRAIWRTRRRDGPDAGPNGTGYGAGCPTTCGDGDEAVYMQAGNLRPVRRRTGHQLPGELFSSQVDREGRPQGRPLSLGGGRSSAR